MAPDQPVKIVIVDDSSICAAILEAGLREAGYGTVHLISEMTNLLATIYAIDPDVILIDLENPRRDVLEQMFQVSRAVKRPIAMFVDQSDTASIQASVDAGVSAYIVDGLTDRPCKSRWSRVRRFFRRTKCRNHRCRCSGTSRPAIAAPCSAARLHSRLSGGTGIGSAKRSMLGRTAKLVPVTVAHPVLYDREGANATA